MSNQPDQPQPLPEEPPKQAPAGYFPPPVPPYQAPVAPDPYAGVNAQFQQPAPPHGQQQYPVPAPSYSQEQYGAPAPYGQQQQPQQYPAPTYYQGGTGYAAYSSGPRGLSLASMIVGLASLVVGFGFLMIPQIVGVILGHLGMSRESPQGRGFAITGLITNYLALLIFGALYGFLIFGFVLMGTDSYSSY